MENTKDNQNGYKIPEGYFEGFEKKVLEKVATTENPKTAQKIVLHTAIKTVFCIAASVVLVVGLFDVLKKRAPLKQEENAFEYAMENVQPADIDAFLDAQMENIDESEIIDMVANINDFEAMEL